MDEWFAMSQAERDAWTAGYAQGQSAAADAIAAFRHDRPGKSAAHYLAALTRAEQIVRSLAASSPPATDGDTADGGTR